MKYHDGAGDRDRRLQLIDELLAASVDATASDAPGTPAPPSKQPAFAAALAARRRAARRGRWMRAFLLAVTLVIAGFALVSWLTRSDRDRPRRDQELVPVEPETGEDPAYLVRTRPLRGAQRVLDGSALVTVSTRPGREVATVTRRAAFAWVSTSAPAPRLNDEQLLEAFAGQPLALIERAPGRKELVFLARTDR